MVCFRSARARGSSPIPPRTFRHAKTDEWKRFCRRAGRGHLRAKNKSNLGQTTVTTVDGGYGKHGRCCSPRTLLITDATVAVSLLFAWIAWYARVQLSPRTYVRFEYFISQRYVRMYLFDFECRIIIVTITSCVVRALNKVTTTKEEVQTRGPKKKKKKTLLRFRRAKNQTRRRCRERSDTRKLNDWKRFRRRASSRAKNKMHRTRTSSHTNLGQKTVRTIDRGYGTHGRYSPTVAVSLLFAWIA